MAWLGTWAKRVKLTIDSGDIDAALTDFPILVYLSTSSGINGEDISFIFDELANDANRLKIAVTATDGTTQRYVEVEKWDDANEHAWLWVKVPSVASGADTDLYLYYDSAQPNNTTFVGDTNSVVADNVWESDFKLVNHMADGADNQNIYDSTDQDNDGVKGAAGEPTEVSDHIGEYQNFDGGDFIGHGQPAELDFTPNTDEFTLTCWLRAAVSATGTLICKGNTTSANRQYQMFVSQNTLRAVIGGTGDVSALNPTDGAWHRCSIINYDDSGTLKFKYILDAAVELGGTSGAATNAFDVLIGARRNVDNTDTGFLITGDEDEGRISSTARSDAWEFASYDSESDDLLDWGTEEEIVVTFRPLIMVY